MNVRRRTLVLGTVFALIGAPALLAPIDAARYHARNRSNGVLLSSGHERDYVLHVPASYDPANATPLVISLHGAALWGAAQRDISGWNAVADRHGFIVAYPSALRQSGPRVWEAFPGPGLIRDVRFIAELIDTIHATYTVDTTRIYVNGLSNGGGMSFVLSCTMSDRIAAIGMVGAAHLAPWEWCEDDRPVPMVAFHGTDDPMVPYRGGPFKDPFHPGAVIFPSVPTWTAQWARRNRCARDPVETQSAPGVTRIQYADCAAGADVVLYAVSGGGHTWPGGGAVPRWFAGPTSNSIDASSEMWAFFRNHRLRREESGTP